jgi:uncharacterized membrane protein
MDILHWPKKQLLYLDLFFIVSVFSISYIDDNILGLSYLRAFFWLLFLLFIPGLHLLRLLKIQKLDFLGSVLFSLGLSLFMLMGVGVFLDFIVHQLSLGYPFSVNFILLAYVFILGLFLSYEYRDYFLFNKEEEIQFNLYKRELDLPPITLYLLLLPLLAFIGSYASNYYNTNQITMIFLFFASLLPIMVGYGKVHRHQYPLAIFMLSLSVLLHTALLTNYIWGWDINIEYSVINDVIGRGSLDFVIPHYLFSMLSLVVIGPILTSVLNLDSLWVIKVIYPVIFSFVPVGIYYFASKITQKEIAFFSSFLCIAIYPFCNDMVQLARQQIAELFLVLFLASLLCCEIGKPKRMFIATIFICGIIFSHYGLAWITIIVLTIGVLLIYLNKLLEMGNFDHHELGKLSNDLTAKINEIIGLKQKTCENIINTILFPITLILFFAWYIYLSSGRFFKEAVGIVDNLNSIIFNEFGSRSSSEGLRIAQDLLVPHKYFTHEITKYLNLITIFGIFVGLVYLTLFKRNKNPEFWAICSGFFLIVVFTVAIPRFSQALNFARFYQIGFLSLCVSSIIGISITIYYIYSIFRLPGKCTHLKILGIFFMFFLLFNTGFIYEVFKDNSNSIALNKDLNSRIYPIWSDSEIQGLSWSDNYITNNYPYTSESRLEQYFYKSFSEITRTRFSSNIKTSDDSGSNNYFIGDKRDKGSFWQKSDMVYNSKAIRVQRM